MSNEPAVLKITGQNNFYLQINNTINFIRCQLYSIPKINHFNRYTAYCN